MSDRLTDLKTRIARVTDLSRSAAILGWDQETYMPDGGAEGRAEQLSTLGGLAHQFFTDEEVGELLTDLKDELADEPYESDDASLVRFHLREYLKQVKVPTKLVMDIARAASKSQHAWQKARAENDFTAFQPHLETMLDLKIQYAEALGSPTDNLYDALVDDWDTALTFDYINGVFGALKPGLTDLVARVSEHADRVSDEVLRQHYDKDTQLAFSKRVSEAAGYDYARGRLDLSAHPFSTSFGSGDVRITTRVYENFLPACMMGTLHETGHAMYEQNVSPDLRRTGLDTGTSLSIHESQSRFYENIIGRSRAFWTHWYPELQSTFPDQLGNVSLDEFYRALNKSEPSLIRVEADELTYGLHIMLRVELENELVNGRLAVKDLPEAWNAKMEEYLGITPPNDTEGVLQDIHWSMGSFGYFADYLLGSIFSVQLWEALKQSIPDAEEQVARGDMTAINSWLNQNIHVHGCKFTFPETSERVTGKPLQWQPYMNYLENKFSEIYQLA